MRRGLRIVFWQRVPYDAFSGGDGLYIDHLKTYLQSTGAEVYTITSHIDRPRIQIIPKYTTASNLLRLRGYYKIGDKWIASPQFFILSALTYFARRLKIFKSASAQKGFSMSERRWVQNEINDLNPDLVVKCFDKDGHEEFSNIRTRRKLHLIGFLNADEFAIEGRSSYSLERKLNSFADSRDSSFSLAEVRLPVGFSSYFDRNRALESNAGIEALFVGIGFDQRFSENDLRNNSALFVGNKTLPNRQAVDYLLRDIWPRVVETLPDARLRIVGRVCRYYSEDVKGVDFVGELDELAEEYARTNVVVAPLLTGSAGVKTKIAEGFRFGRAVVTTSLGVDQSCPDQFAGAAFLASSSSDFSDRIIEVLSDNVLRESMERKSLEVFISNFSWDAAYSELREWMEKNDM